ncbi:hypothetical protein DEA06_14740 [Microbacterium sp. Gd 4-13]|uniref:FHA domain-containing protein n=1 Tax=Microbacterium sp. Gd 4-13 TaxID=2173179 RepID=UPI000D56802D|nr:FHA domain-containing protein [Microbacterium sp. Gd 4-13]PVW03015.1 hypothetical protein DEA06_14740 [Microbacterium sp. Gd 4-13]
MSIPPVPSYPVIYVNVAPDGSGHLNVAGQHHDYPVGSPEYTRRAVTAFATELAVELRRPVRMQITDSHGRWLVAVHPSGTITDLEPVAEKPRRARKRDVATPAAHPHSPSAANKPSAHPAPSPPAYRSPTRDVSPVATHHFLPPAMTCESSFDADPTSLDDVLERTRLSERKIPPHPSTLGATLTFSTGHIAHIPPGGALVGRRPSAEPGEQVELTAVDDQARSVSRTHLRLHWERASLWATDRASSNGTRIGRAQEPPRGLTPWQPFQLHDGDVVELGDVYAVVAIQASNPGMDRQ